MSFQAHVEPTTSEAVSRASKARADRREQEKLKLDLEEVVIDESPLAERVLATRGYGLFDAADQLMAVTFSGGDAQRAAAVFGLTSSHVQVTQKSAGPAPEGSTPAFGLADRFGEITGVVLNDADASRLAVAMVLRMVKVLVRAVPAPLTLTEQQATADRCNQERCDGIRYLLADVEPGGSADIPMPSEPNERRRIQGCATSVASGLWGRLHFKGLTQGPVLTMTRLVQPRTCGEAASGPPPAGEADAQHP